METGKREKKLAILNKWFYLPIDEKKIWMDIKKINTNIKYKICTETKHIMSL